MKFTTSLLITNNILHSQLELKYGSIIISQYPYFISLNDNYIFTLNILYELFSNEIINQDDKISLNKFETYLKYDYKINTNAFLHSIDTNTKKLLNNQFITIKQDNNFKDEFIDDDKTISKNINQYKILDLIEDEHYILPRDILQKYYLLVCYLNGKYILLSSSEQLHEYFSELEAKHLLKQL